MAAPLPILLDISRTISRAGRGHDTGIDRVERAYIQWAMARAGTGFLARMGRKAGFIEAESAARLFEELPGVEAARNWPLGKLMPGLSARDRRAERLVARYARAVAHPESLLPALRRHYGGDFAYLNVGHTHLDPARLAALKAAGARRRLVMIHDVIPITHPKTQTARSVTTFRKRLSAAATGATHLLTSTEATAAQIAAHLPAPAPPLIAIPLGVLPPAQTEAHTQSRPYFVQLGTVEPRKNTALLLDVWPGLPAPRPQLQLIGARGWLADPLFERIAAQGDDITHLDGLSDAQTTARLMGAQALLFPSIAEGFGYPLLEAAQLGTPIIASNLRVFRELLQNGPLYLPPEDATSWSQEITKQANRSLRARADPAPPSVPRWPDHFDRLQDLLIN